jgi:hypothetical protein
MVEAQQNARQSYTKLKVGSTLKPRFKAASSLLANRVFALVQVEV